MTTPKAPFFPPICDTKLAVRAISAADAFVEGVLVEGAKRARVVAREIMADARDACGIVAAQGTHEVTQ
jgi:hypothetical protein